jgi:hypothetical protein
LKDAFAVEILEKRPERSDSTCDGAFAEAKVKLRAQVRPQHLTVNFVPGCEMFLLEEIQDLGQINLIILDGVRRIISFLFEIFQV